MKNDQTAFISRKKNNYEARLLNGFVITSNKNLDILMEVLKANGFSRFLIK